MSLADIGQGAQALAEQIGHVGSWAVTIITDVGEDHHSRAFIEQIRNRLSRVDALVNNDGVMQPSPSDGAATDQWRRAGDHRPARRWPRRSSPGRGGRRPVRVLVAADVRRLADDIAEVLRDQGIAADVAHGGADAAAKLDLNPYDVLVLDRDLPGIHGDTICRTITAAGHPVMILMLTAAVSPGDRVTGLALGADDYLPKPSTSPNSCCASAPWPAASPPPSPVLARLPAPW